MGGNRYALGVRREHVFYRAIGGTLSATGIYVLFLLSMNFPALHSKTQMPLFHENPLGARTGGPRWRRLRLFGQSEPPPCAR